MTASIDLNGIFVFFSQTKQIFPKMDVGQARKFNNSYEKWKGGLTAVVFVSGNA